MGSPRLNGMQTKSLVLGFCECANCHFEKFYWNTHFTCDKCGCDKFIKRPWEEDLLDDKKRN